MLFTIQMGRYFFSFDFGDRVYAEFKTIGFSYTALDLKGCKTGSMKK